MEFQELCTNKLGRECIMMSGNVLTMGSLFVSDDMFH